MSDNGHVYEARHGLNRSSAAVLAASATFTVLLLLPAIDVSLVLRIAGLVLFGGGGLVVAAGALTRKTALRVDHTGVLLGGSPLRHRATTIHVPWQDVTAVVLWNQALPPATRPMLWIGTARREGPPPLHGPGQGPLARTVADALVPVSADLLMASRQVNGWRLDTERLRAAVAHFAPGTELVDHRWRVCREPAWTAMSEREPRSATDRPGLPAGSAWNSTAGGPSKAPPSASPGLSSRWLPQSGTTTRPTGPSSGP